jgi:hypothetical protein
MHKYLASRSNGTNSSALEGQDSGMSGRDTAAKANYNSADLLVSASRRATPKFIIVILLFICMSAGCGGSGDRAASEAATAQFHRQLDAEQYSAIYREADDQLHEVISEAKLTEVLTAIHEKLGVVRSAKVKGWLVNASTRGTFVTIVDRTMFTTGEGEERFVWRMRDGRARLLKYNVNSDALLLK